MEKAGNMTSRNHKLKNCIKQVKEKALSVVFSNTKFCNKYRL